MVSGQMTRGAAISMALLAIIVLALIVLLAWSTHTWLVDLEARKRISRSRSRLDPDRAVGAVTDAIKRNLVADMRVSPSDCQLDHIVPLDLGSAPLIWFAEWQNSRGVYWLQRTGPGEVRTPAPVAA